MTFHNINIIFVLFRFRLTAEIAFRATTTHIKHVKTPSPMAVLCFSVWPRHTFLKKNKIMIRISSTRENTLDYL